ncbi:DUF1294 domain-containing protein [Streptobacillus felis]
MNFLKLINNINIIILFNVFSFIIFGIDKFLAIKNMSRISEKMLLRISLLGPFGAIISMIFFRHKIKKKKFIFVYFFSTIHIFILLYLKYFRG